VAGLQFHAAPEGEIAKTLAVSVGDREFGEGVAPDLEPDRLK
jgi:hypothetical protein